MKRFSLLITLLAVLGLVLTACSGRNHTINADANGTSISLQKGDTLTLKIGGNPTTGYSWEVSDIDSSILSPEGDPDYRSGSPLIGAGGTYTFKFTADAPGTTTLKLIYYRTFEKDIPPMNTFEVTVTVEE